MVGQEPAFSFHCVFFPFKMFQKQTLKNSIFYFFYFYIRPETKHTSKLIQCSTDSTANLWFKELMNGSAFLVLHFDFWLRAFEAGSLHLSRKTTNLTCSIAQAHQTVFYKLTLCRAHWWSACFQRQEKELPLEVCVIKMQSRALIIHRP